MSLKAAVTLAELGSQLKDIQTTLLQMKWMLALTLALTIVCTVKVYLC